MANVGRMSSFWSNQHIYNGKSTSSLCYCGYFTNRWCHMERSPGHQVYKRVYWMLGQFSKSILVRCPYLLKIQDSITIHTTKDIPLPHHPWSLWIYLWCLVQLPSSPHVSLSSPTWDPGERPYDHGSSWPHPLPSKHTKDEEIWEDFRRRECLMWDVQAHPYHMLTHIDVQLSAIQMINSPCPNQQMIDKHTQMMLSNNIRILSYYIIHIHITQKTFTQLLQLQYISSLAIILSCSLEETQWRYTMGEGHVLHPW